MSTHGAVAIIETPKSFVLEGRPNWPGKLAFASMTGLFGGHVEPGEDAPTAVTRELWVRSFAWSFKTSQYNSGRET
jgi:8-oxo-dGTP pyrophosphatase MutT (NUDIX family)